MARALYHSTKSRRIMGRTKASHASIMTVSTRWIVGSSDRLKTATGTPRIKRAAPSLRR
jgi:hypothetical protein